MNLSILTTVKAFYFLRIVAFFLRNGTLTEKLFSLDFLTKTFFAISIIKSVERCLVVVQQVVVVGIGLVDRIWSLPLDVLRIRKIGPF